MSTVSKEWPAMGEPTADPEMIEISETQLTLWQRALACIGYSTFDGWKIIGVTDSPGLKYPMGTYVTMVKFGEKSKHVPFENIEYTSLHKAE